MTISGIPDNLLQQISNSATRPGDAVAVTMMRKVLDIQASQATQLIQSANQSAAPDPSARLGLNIDIRV